MWLRIRSENVCCNCVPAFYEGNTTLYRSRDSWGKALWTQNRCMVLGDYSVWAVYWLPTISSRDLPKTRSEDHKWQGHLPEQHVRRIQIVGERDAPEESNQSLRLAKHPKASVFQPGPLEDPGTAKTLKRLLPKPVFSDHQVCFEVHFSEQRTDTGCFERAWKKSQAGWGEAAQNRYGVLSRAGVPLYEIVERVNGRCGTAYSGL